MSVGYYIAEGQLARTFHDRPEDAAPLTDRGACLKLLGFEHWDTGGNCTALGIERADGAQVLITDDGSDPYRDKPDQAPRGNATTVTIGYYDAQGEFDCDTWREYAPDQTEALVRAVIAWLDHQYDAHGGDAERSNGPNRRQS